MAWQSDSAMSLASLPLMQKRTAPTQSSSPLNAMAIRSSAACSRPTQVQPSLTTGVSAARRIASTIAG
ncbi:hypothetical protein ABH985_001767 [Bradyrhizobium ottawaense]